MTDSIGRDAGLSVNADGTLSYKFQGVIEADGVDLHAAGSRGAIERDNQVRWMSGAGDEMGSIAYVYDYNRISDAFRGMVIAADNEERTLLDYKGRSDFLQGSGNLYGPFEMTLPAMPSAGQTVTTTYETGLDLTLDQWQIFGASQSRPGFQMPGYGAGGAWGRAGAALGWGVDRTGTGQLTFLHVANTPAFPSRFQFSILDYA